MASTRPIRVASVMPPPPPPPRGKDHVDCNEVEARKYEIQLTYNATVILQTVSRDWSILTSVSTSDEAKEETQWDGVVKGVVEEAEPTLLATPARAFRAPSRPRGQPSCHISQAHQTRY
jgi:hypothetical protein